MDWQNKHSEVEHDTLTAIIKDFAWATDFGSVVVDIRGTENSSFYNFSKFCKLMRANPQFHSLCQKCDMYGGLEASKTGHPSIYRCHAGLTDISLPIIKQNQLSGFLLFGQVQAEDVDTNYYTCIQQTQTNWQAHPELRQARNEIKLVTSQQIKSAAKILKLIGEYHSDDDDPRKQITFSVKSRENDELKAQPADNQEIKKALHYIQKNLTHHLTLEQVADHVYLSQFYFSKLFKRKVGVNFITYLNQQRMEQAKSLLKESSLSVDAISRSLGFSQASYFCKIFKDQTSYTPAKYRKIHTG